MQFSLLKMTKKDKVIKKYIYNLYLIYVLLFSVLHDPKQISSWDNGVCESELKRISRAVGFPVIDDLIS